MIDISEVKNVIELPVVLAFKETEIINLVKNIFNSLLASGEFCPLLTIFANSLDPDQARQNVRPGLDPCCLTLQCYLEKSVVEKQMRTIKKHEKLPRMQKLKLLSTGRS